MIEFPLAYKTPEFKEKVEIVVLVVLCARALSHKLWGMSAVGLVVVGALVSLLYLFYLDLHYYEEKNRLLRWLTRFAVGFCPIGFSLVNAGLQSVRYVMLGLALLLFVIAGVRYWWGSIGREAIIRMVVIYACIFSIGSR